MSKALKILSAFLVLLILLIGTVFFLASRYLTEERIKAFLIPPLEQASGLKVSLGKIKRQGFAGVVVREVAFLDPATHEKVLSADKIRLALDLWPLLHGKLVVTKLVFEHPQLSVVREKDGTLNLERYFGAQKKGAVPKEETSAEEGSRPKSEGTAKWALVFQHLAVKGAHISFKDLQGQWPAVELLFSLEAALRLQGASLSVEGDEEVAWLKVASYPVLKGLKGRLSLSQKGLALTLCQGELLGGTLSGAFKSDFKDLEGKVSLEKASFEELNRLLGVLKPYFFPQATLPKFSGAFALQGEFQGPLKEPRYNLVLNLSPLSLTQPPYQLSLSGQVGLNPTQIRPDLHLTINGQTLALSGTVSRWQSPLPQVDLGIKADQLDLKALLPPEEAQPKGPSTGKPSPTAQTATAPLVLPVKGKISLQAQSICYDLCAQKIDAKAQLSPQKIDLHAAFVLAEGQVKTAVQVKDLAHKAYTALNFKIERLVLPELLKALSPKSAYVTSGLLWAQGAFRTQGLSAEVIEKNLKGKGEAKFTHLGLKEIPAAVIAADLLGVPDLTRLSFDQGNLIFSVAQEKVSLDGAFTRPGLALNLRGDVAFKGYLDLKPVLVFDEPYASKLRKRLPGANFLEDQGKLEVPLEVKGPFAKPKVRLRLTKKIKKKLEEKVKQKLFEFLGR